MKFKLIWYSLFHRPKYKRGDKVRYFIGDQPPIETLATYIGPFVDGTEQGWQINEHWITESNDQVSVGYYWVLAAVASINTEGT